MRRTFGVVFVTIPSKYYKTEKSGREACQTSSAFVVDYEIPYYFTAVENLVDAVLEIDSISPQNPLSKEFQGFVTVRKLPIFNSLAPSNPESTFLAFKCRRSKFSIEKFHIPPELSNEPPSRSSGGCGNGSSKMEF